MSKLDFFNLEYIPLGMALTIKKLKFNIESDTYWCNYYLDHPADKWAIHYDSDITGIGLKYNNYEFPRPSIYELQKYIRDNHQIHIECNVMGDYKSYQSIVFSESDKDGRLDAIVEFIKADQNPVYSSYEVALTQGLYKALKIIKNKSK